MPVPVQKHKFNDDLLLKEEDQKHAATRYPAISHVLDNPELRTLFSDYDEGAKRAKIIGRRTGLVAIILVFFALALAASEHLLGEEKANQAFWTLPTILALLSGFFGLLGVIIGGIGVLHSEKKRRWLQSRLMTERIRQFHFQTFVCRLPDIFESLKGPVSKQAFAEKRALWLDHFKAGYIGKLDSQFTDIIEEENGQDIWLHEKLPPFDFTESDQLQPLFEAYRELRIEHQIGYANYKLQNDPTLFTDAPRSQAAFLSTTGLACIVLLCAIHFFVLLGVLIRWTGAPLSGWMSLQPVVTVISIWIALTALAMRAVEEGLQPEREIERYQQYRSALRAIRDRFDTARSQSEKVRIMQEMERLSFDEMRNFLITNDRTRFVM